MKGAQMTMTIIISLIVIGLFAAAFYITSSIVVNKVDVGKTQQQQGAETIGPMRDFVGLCLETVSREGLKLLGNQGGRIYVSQGGATPDGIADKDYVQLADGKLSYGIKEAPGSLGRFYVTGSFKGYPWENFPYLLPSRNTFFEGYYGLNTLPTLEGTPSASQDLKKYVEFSLVKCLDWSSFTQRGVIISAGAPVVDVVFADTNTRFELAYPANISVPGGLSSSFAQFTATHPVRLRHLLAFAHGAADSDVKDITFDLSRPTSQDMSIDIQREDPMNHIVSIKDPLSTLVNQPYGFRFARQNRQPGIFLLENENPLCADTNVTRAGFTLMIEACDAVYSHEVGYADPDEDRMNISTVTLSSKVIDEQRSHQLGPGPDSILNITITDPGGKQDQQNLELNYQN